jgi:hypothetical protein
MTWQKKRTTSAVWNSRLRCSALITLEVCRRQYIKALTIKAAHVNKKKHMKKSFSLLAAPWPSVSQCVEKASPFA